MKVFEGWQLRQRIGSVKHLSHFAIHDKGKNALYGIGSGAKTQFMEMMMLYTAVIHQEEEWFVAECPEVGTASQGKTVEEAISNLREATEVYLEEFPAKVSGHLILATFEVRAHA